MKFQLKRNMKIDINSHKVAVSGIENGGFEMDEVDLNDNVASNRR